MEDDDSMVDEYLDAAGVIRTFRLGNAAPKLTHSPA